MDESGLIAFILAAPRNYNSVLNQHHINRHKKDLLRKWPVFFYGGMRAEI
jgi:hypothetical protein